MSPTQNHQHRDALFDLATSRGALNAAWLYVRPRLEKSKDPKIRSDAAEFGSNVYRSISKLQRQLRNGSFVFEQQTGILKRRKSKRGEPKKEPRPIVVAPAKNRIVQRAILDTCQSEDKAIRRKLGQLLTVIQCPTSVGGLPGRGVPEAVSKISAAMRGGATWYVRSDLKNFFQAVPKNAVKQFLDLNVRFDRFNQLFMDALTTELANEDEVRELLQLFPTGPKGVPQGSALSALCANIVLSDFDAQFNKLGITTIRYLDDFVMLGKGHRRTEIAFQAAQRLLENKGFKCHNPFKKGSSKASSGLTQTGFEFLSFRLSPSKTIPSRSACRKFLEDLDVTIGTAKSEIRDFQDSARRAEPRFIQALSLLDKKIRGWGDAFRPSTERLIFD